MPDRALRFTLLENALDQLVAEKVAVACGDRLFRVRSYSISYARDFIEVTAFGDTQPAYVQGLPISKASFDLVIDGDQPDLVLQEIARATRTNGLVIDEEVGGAHVKGVFHVESAAFFREVTGANIVRVQATPRGAITVEEASPIVELPKERVLRFA